MIVTSLPSISLIPLTALFAISVLVIKCFFYLKGYYTSDLAYYANMLYNTNFSSRILYSDILVDLNGTACFLNDHFSPTFLLLVPFYRIFPSPLLLVILQSVLPVCSAIILYKIGSEFAEKRPYSLFHNLLPFVIAAYLFHPSSVYATFDTIYGFHHDCLFPLLFFLCFYFYIKDKLKYYILCLILMLGIKENIPFIVLVGSFIFVRAQNEEEQKPRQRKKVYFICSLALALFFLFVGLFLYPFLSIGGIGTRHSGVIANLSFTHFIQKLPHMWQWLILFFFFPAIFSPWLLMMAVPELVMLTICEKFSAVLWYAFYSTAIFTAAALWGLKKLEHLKSRVLFRYCVNASVVCFLVCICGGFFVIAKKGLYCMKFPSLYNPVSAAQLYASIPHEAVLKTTSDLCAFCANRPHLTFDTKKAQYFLVNRNLEQLSNEIYKRNQMFIEELMHLSNQKKIRLVRKTADGLELYAKLY